MTEPYKKRYEGTRWSLRYGSYEGVQRFAVDELQRTVQAWLPYVIETMSAQTERIDANHVLVGTPAEHPEIERLVSEGHINAPGAPESYEIKVFDSPWSSGKRLAVIAGHDESGVLYGVQDFNNRVLRGRLYPDRPETVRKAFDEMQDIAISETPAVRNRGIWTWGYVIYDYRRFIDNMARLKMNMLTIWNDCVPLNIESIIEYAHSRGVKVVLGFHWGWGLKNIELGNPEHRKQLKQIVLDEYERTYSCLHIDGVYFQTLTEIHETMTCGMTIAAAACEFVNDTARSLLERHPDLDIQFGLHAISILDNLDDLKELDPRVTITWEDAGVIPYSYNPVKVPSGWTQARGLDTFEKTLEYSIELVNLRPNSVFAMVPKGFICLRWGAEFEHHGPFILGERDPEFIRNRLRERQPRWDEVNSLWLKNYRLASTFYRELLDRAPAGMTLTALVEDGMFEEKIQPSVAIFGETVWNPRRDDEQILEFALNHMR